MKFRRHFKNMPYRYSFDFGLSSLRARRYRLRDISSPLSWVKYVFWFLGALCVFAFSYTIFIVGVYLWDRSDIGEQIKSYREWVYGVGTNIKKPPIKIYASDKTLIGEYLPERGSRMTMSACSELKWLKKAVIVAEDHDFYNHGGVSYVGLFRALWRNLGSLSIKEGGGTVTQQLARNLFTNRERSFYRKLYETLVAFQLEANLSKEEIFCLYLNKIYMGEGRIGAEEASWFYFRKAPRKLDAAEAAMIVGIFPSPVYYSPLNNIQLSLKKQGLVLNQLVQMEELTRQERNEIMGRFWKRYGLRQTEELNHGSIGAYGASRDFRYNVAPAVNEYVKNFLYKALPEEMIREGGLKVYTTIDAKRQATALRTIRDRVIVLRQAMLRKNQRANPVDLKRWSNRLNGVFLSLDVFSGDVKAVVGGYGIAEGNMTHRVWSMLRQPGSAIKGFLYAVALDEAKLSFDSFVLDQPINIGNYRPKNWNNKYLGEVPLAKAVAMSINTVAVQTLNNVGVSTFRNRLAKVLHLDFFQKRKRFPSNLSLALGSGEVKPIELALLYAAIANGGYPVKQRLIRYIENANKQLLWKASMQQKSGNSLFSASSCQSTLRLMSYVFDPELEGTASFIGRKRLQNSSYLSFPVAGKTGTVQIPRGSYKRFPKMRGARDIWFVGIVPREVSVVWFGQDEGAPIPGSGATAAGVWAIYAQRVWKGKITDDFFIDAVINDDFLSTDDTEENPNEQGETTDDTDESSDVPTADKKPEQADKETEKETNVEDEASVSESIEEPQDVDTLESDSSPNADENPSWPNPDDDIPDDIPDSESF